MIYAAIVICFLNFPELVATCRLFYKHRGSSQIDCHVKCNFEILYMKE